MRAKFNITEVIIREHSQSLKMQAVSSGAYGPNGESEDNTFSRWTPTGNLEMSITNPDLQGKFNPGDAYYLDFTKVAQHAS